jgi:hypothetical protein
MSDKTIARKLTILRDELHRAETTVHHGMQVIEDLITSIQASGGAVYSIGKARNGNGKVARTGKKETRGGTRGREPVLMNKVADAVRRNRSKMGIAMKDLHALLPEMPYGTLSNTLHRLKVAGKIASNEGKYVYVKPTVMPSVTPEAVSQAEA